MEKPRQNWASTLAMAMNLALSVGTVMAIGLFGGRWLDAKLGTGYILTMVGFCLGAASAGKMLWERLMADNTQANPNRKRFPK